MRRDDEALRVMVVLGREEPGEFAALTEVVTELCPRVESMELGVLAFAARGPSRYFGGEAALAEKIMAVEGVTGVGVADGMFAGLLAAGEGVIVPVGQTKRFLARQPVKVLGDDDLASLLVRLGITTLGDLAALPEADVAARFGAAGEAAHRLARGGEVRRLAATQPAKDLSVTQEFDPPEELSEPVVFAAKALAERFHQGLAKFGLSAVRVQVKITAEDGSEFSRMWRHDGLLTAVQVADRVRWQLEKARGAIQQLTLAPDHLVRAVGRQLALWGEAPMPDKVARAAMRIQALIGHEAVLRPMIVGGRDAAERVEHAAFGEMKDPSRPQDQPWPGRIPGPAPTVVFPEPRNARVTDSTGKPVTISGRCAMSGEPARLMIDGERELEVTGWAGPWPLTQHWWDEQAASRRARFQLMTGDGRAWLAAMRDGGWQVEGGYW